MLNEKELNQLYEQLLNNLTVKVSNDNSNQKLHNYIVNICAQTFVEGIKIYEEIQDSPETL